jgi:hypothetical protein
MGVPSLPSSILFYHQKMTTANVVMSGKTPRFSPHAFNSSQASSLEYCFCYYLYPNCSDYSCYEAGYAVDMISPR